MAKRFSFSPQLGRIKIRQTLLRGENSNALARFSIILARKVIVLTVQSWANMFSLHHNGRTAL